MRASDWRVRPIVILGLVTRIGHGAVLVPILGTSPGMTIDEDGASDSFTLARRLTPPAGST